MHGTGTDGLPWFDRSDSSRVPLPQLLFDAGYDVYVANLQGTNGSQGHATLDRGDEGDFTNGSQVYWDFNASDIAEKNIPAMINAINSQRQAEGRDCKKVQILGYGHGAS